MSPSRGFARWQQRTYLFGVTALAVLLVGSLAAKVISGRSSSYRATAVVARDGVSPAGAPGNVRLGGPEAWGIAHELAAQVHVEQHQASQGTEAVSVTSTARTSAAAISLANQAAEQLAKSLEKRPSPVSRPDLRAARTETGRAREELAAVRRAMATLVANPPVLPETAMLAPPENEPAQAPNAPDLALEAPSETPDPASITAPLSEWDAAHQELTALESTRGELLQHMTTAHPSIQKLDEDIAAATARLMSIPRDAPNEPHPPTANEPLPRLTPPADATPPPAALTPADVATLESLHEHQAQFAQMLASQMQALRTAEARLEACNAAEQQAALESNSARPANDWRIEPAANAKLATAPVSKWVGALIVLVAIAAGVLLAAIGERQSAPFATRQEAEKLLPVPVMGVINGGGSGNGQTSVTPRLIVLGVRRTCEAALVMALMAGVLVTASDFISSDGITGRAVRWGWETIGRLSG